VQSAVTEIGPGGSVIGRIGGPGGAPVVAATAAIGADDDADMMHIFDEDEPSDIHALDRMLAAATSAQAAGDSAGADDQLEGDFHGVEHLLTPTSPDARTHASVGAAAADGRTQESPAQPAKLMEAPAIAAALPVMPVIEPGAAAGNARDAGSMFAGAPALATAGDGASSLVPLPGAVIAPVEKAAPLPDKTPEPAAKSAAPDTKARAAPAPRRSRSNPIRSAMSAVASFVALSNLPLRVVPASLRPTVNIVSVSLALWAPVIWFAGPKIAQRAAAASTSSAAHHEPAHHGSTIRPEKTGHGEAKKTSHGGH
jgi:hypothetical protein